MGDMNDPTKKPLRWTQHAPCDACPYRRDTPAGIWSPEEYAALVRADADGDSMRSATYGCHLNASRAAEEAQPCAGWLADQKRRGVPSIPLRLTLRMRPAALACFERVNEADPNLYGSIAEMVRANRGKRFPTRAPKAKRLLRKLEGHGR